ncbi:phosphopantothenate--cysteine ligase, putative, partial [Hepatocystis sp. ex Piliocolobus tephrosceles]
MQNYFLEYPSFFTKELRPKNLDKILEKLQNEFLKDNSYDNAVATRRGIRLNGHPCSNNITNKDNDKNNSENIQKSCHTFVSVVLITSGGTMAPLEKVNIRNVDNFSTGRRGCHVAECFLKQNKKVIFLYRKNTYKPFEYNLKHMASFENMKKQEDNIIFKLSEQNNNILINDYIHFEKYKKNIFCIEFETIFDYGYYLIEICNLLNKDLEHSIEEELFGESFGESVPCQYVTASGLAKASG